MTRRGLITDHHFICCARSIGLMIVVLDLAHHGMPGWLPSWQNDSGHMPPHAARKVPVSVSGLWWLQRFFSSLCSLRHIHTVLAWCSEHSRVHCAQVQRTSFQTVALLLAESVHCCGQFMRTQSETILRWQLAYDLVCDGAARVAELPGGSLRPAVAALPC